MTIGNPRHLDHIADFLRTQRNEDVSLSDVVALAEITATSLQTFFENMDVAIYRELREIAEYIQAMKIEIGALGVNEIRNSAFRPRARSSEPSSRRPKTPPTPSWNAPRR